jgi:F0F1-type ATP synthase membrane subunit a
LAGKALGRLGLAVGLAVLFCIIIPHVLLPSLGIGVALPFIYVPGEKIPGFPLTNTYLTTIITSFLLLVFAWQATKNMKEVPGRLQAAFEMLVEFIDNLTKSVIGPKSRKVFPWAATIFLSVLFANYIKLLPGFDTVGILECAPIGSSGYWANSNTPLATLFVPSSLNSGFKATEADFIACEKIVGKYHGSAAGHGGAQPTAAATAGAAKATAVATKAATPTAKPTQAATKSAMLPDKSDSMILAAPANAPQQAEGGGSDKITADELAMIALTRKIDTQPALKVTDLSEAEKAMVTVAANGTLSVKKPLRELYIIVPFFRGPASDLTYTLVLAIVAVIMIQVLGVQENGSAYWYKYVNLPALANIGNPKKPANGFLGPIDFVVGLLEIISEISKILSFAFRLFGNIFAGQVLIFVMVFLVATGLPLIFIGLEAFVGVIQPFVFALLFTVLAGVAMSGHHGDDDHGDDHAHDGSH